MSLFKIKTLWNYYAGVIKGCDNKYPRKAMHWVSCVLNYSMYKLVLDSETCGILKKLPIMSTLCDNISFDLTMDVIIQIFEHQTIWEGFQRLQNFLQSEKAFKGFKVFSVWEGFQRLQRFLQSEKAFISFKAFFSLRRPSLNNNVRYKYIWRLS